LLSGSLSPALGPCGIPLELELDALEPAALDLVVVAGGELFVVVAVFAGEAVLVTAGELFVEEEEELPELPQPAAMTPATTRATIGSPRASLNLLNMANLVSVVNLVGRKLCLMSVTLYAGQPSLLALGEGLQRRRRLR